MDGRTMMSLAVMTALLMVPGFAFRGGADALVALLAATGMNPFTFRNTDRIVLRVHDARGGCAQ